MKNNPVPSCYGKDIDISRNFQAQAENGCDDCELRKCCHCRHPPRVTKVYELSPFGELLIAVIALLCGAIAVRVFM